MMAGILIDMSMDTTGGPMHKGTRSRGSSERSRDGTAKTHEVQVITVYATNSVHPETSGPEKDPGSGFHTTVIGGAATVNGISRAPDFVGRLEREIVRHGIRGRKRLWCSRTPPPGYPTSLENHS